MKIYLYDCDSGVYQGEDFVADEGQWAGSMPAGATTVEPPPAKGGEAPIFDAATRRWELRPVAALRKGSGHGTLDRESPEERRR
ncbi:hypothetical protein GURASL_00670 [Geotalea uraniireducens]|uniref:Uncharacterized protein n=1 Tax=Geotalea uraniireducens TaxID=351604 RepID=A0ABM8EGQ9_9BACT|nr:hypothetical protein [Geotalea uraniireducens]BDV41144.1 hypothetical protein GURASL_00670 [Geotalea uraniireducens]